MITVIVDANVIISGIVNPLGIIPSILIKESYKIELVVPNYALEEIELHRKRICRIAKVDDFTFTDLLSRLIENSIIFSDDSIQDKTLAEARPYALGVDTRDLMYIAYALELGALLWTGDKKLYRGLRRKKFKNVITTSEFQQIIKGL